MKKKRNKSTDYTDFTGYSRTPQTGELLPVRKSVGSVKSVDKRERKSADYADFADRSRPAHRPAPANSAKSVDNKLPAIQVYPYQQRWLDDKSRFKLWVKSVQIGATFAQCLEAALDCAKSKRKTDALWILLSASERQALEMARTARQICQSAGIVAELTENEFFDQTMISQHRIEFPNGARILALPANPDTARGYAGHVVLDEFAIHRDAREIWRAAFGRASRGYKIRVLSSPKGQSGKFFELARELGLASGTAPAYQPAWSNVQGPKSNVKDSHPATLDLGRWTVDPAHSTPHSAFRTPHSPWSGHWTDIHLAVREGCPLNIGELRAASGDEETWLQEYCCIFLGDSQAFIPLEAIAACESAEASLDFDSAVPSGATEKQVPRFAPFQPEPQRSTVQDHGRLERGFARDDRGSAARDLFFGFDVGRKHDLAVLVVVEKLGDVLRVRKLLDLAQAPFAVQKQAVRDAAQYCLRGCLDATGMGAQMAEELAAEFPGRVEPVEFTLQVKQDLAVRARRLFEERRIRIPDHAGLRRDISAVKRLITPAGNVRFDAERTDAGHADRFWALALALAAADSGLPAASLGVDASAEFGMRNAEFMADFGLADGKFAEFNPRRSFFQAAI